MTSAADVAVAPPSTDAASAATTAPGTDAALETTTTAAGDAAPGAVARPVWNTGAGFFVQNRTIYDANGVEFRIRGVNHTHWWGSNNTQAIPYMANAHVNTTRAVFGPGQSDAQTPEARRAVVQQYIAQGIVPMVDYHNATCDENPASVSAAVDFWLGPDKAWLQGLERYVMLNITNEWGPNSTVWRDAYLNAVARLRAAGVKNLLVIDAGGDCGQDAQSVETWGREIFDADPEKNVVFSVHMYGFWVDPGSAVAGTWDGRQPYDIDAELGRLDATGLPIVVGEFSWNTFNQVTYRTQSAVAAFEKHGVGWLAWMWFNPGGDVTVDMATSQVYTQSSDLTDFGHFLIEDPNVGLMARARKATIF
jgi:mannan endo-1,4-beta-mannosidase